MRGFSIKNFLFLWCERNSQKKKQKQRKASKAILFFLDICEKLFLKKGKKYTLDSGKLMKTLDKHAQEVEVET